MRETNDAETTSWLERHPMLIALPAAAGLLGIFQGLVLLAPLEGFPGGWPMIVGMFKLGLIAGLLTWLLLTPLALLLSRLHPAWRRGEKLLAGWSVCLGLTGAMAVWTALQGLVNGPNIPEAYGPWIAVLAALGAGTLISFVRLSPRYLKLAASAGVALMVLSVLPLGPSFAPALPPPAPQPESPSPARAPDVVLISIDTLRIDRLGAYGRSPTLTPAVDRLAEEGVVFSRVLASSPWTVPSVASMMTGLSSLRHGAGLPISSGLTFRRSPLENQFTTLAEHFAAAGYRTRAVVSNPFLSPDMGMAQGFEQYESPFTSAMGVVFMNDLPLGRLLLALIPPEKWADYRAEGVTGRALQWLDEESDRPLFLWAHYLDPHTPYQADPRQVDLKAMIDEVRSIPPPTLEDGTVVGEVFAATSFVRSGTLWLSSEDRRRLEVYYDRAVRYLDGQLERVFEKLRDRGRPVILAFTADHGEEFWDHGHFEHGHDYYREITAVPLIFWSPGLAPAATRVDTPVGLVDVAPTLLDLAGLPVEPPPDPLEGRVLTPLWTEGTETIGGLPRLSGNNLYGLPAVLVEDGPWRYILRANGVEELYDVTQDPAERHNRVADRPNVAAGFRALMQPQLALYLKNSSQPESGISEETLRALRSLGYVR